MARSFLLWLHGLAAALIGAVANSIVMVGADTALNQPTQWRKTLISALFMGVIQAAAYLAKSPLPSIPTNEEKS